METKSFFLYFGHAPPAQKNDTQADCSLSCILRSVLEGLESDESGGNEVTARSRDEDHRVGQQNRGIIG